MLSKKIRIMPFILTCGSGLLNLILMCLPFLNNHGNNISGYVLISYNDDFGLLRVFIAVFQVLIMLLAYGMLFYGAVGILCAAGVASIDMSRRRYRLLCTLSIFIVNLLYVVQFILITVHSINTDLWIGVGIYMSMFLNLGVTIMSVVLQKEPISK